MKEIVSYDAPKRIKSIQFGVLSPQQIVDLSQLEVVDRSLYQQGTATRTPAVGGPNDVRLGIWDKDANCATCGLKMADCVGHFGYIKLVLPVFHVGFFKHCIQILQVICKSCSFVLLDESQRRHFLNIFRRRNLENLTRTRTFKAVNTSARKVLHCPRCGHINGTVKKAGPLKIVHEKYRHKKVAEDQRHFHKSFDHMINQGGTGIGSGGEVKQHLQRAQDDLNPLRVLELFKRISDEDCELLGLRPEHGRPEEYLWQYICVPPVCIRPAVAQDANTNEDDITIKIAEIVFANGLLKVSIGKGAAVSQLMEQWEFLQTTVAVYINSELPGLASALPGGGKPIRGFCQRLKGKQGRFRGNLSGKRVDFSGRTVISPDPNLKIDEVAVPERVAKILTYPDRVFEHNIESLRQAVRNGANKHPGANFIVDSKTGFKRMIKFMAKPEVAADHLKVGDVVERHIKDGDIVLFNRQPSLHKLSIMSHRVKVRPWRTFRLNECACNPYNADFDGDEMNMHVPQTEEARTEATVLMGVKHNLVTPRNGEPIIAAIQDFITASFLISNRDRFFDRKQFVQVCSTFGDATLHIDIPPPAILKPVRLWTGKQVFGCLMRPNLKSVNGEEILVNLEAKCRTFEKPQAGFIDDMSPNDGYLVIQNSEVMCGVMDKATVGDGKKNSVFGVMLRDYGSSVAIEAMNRLAKMCARWLANQGFSLGINDVMPGQRLRSTKDAKVEAAYAKCLDLIEKAKLGRLENLAGCDQEQTLESEISGVLSDVRGDVGKICMTELSRHNAPLVMAVCGSKGSQINVAQMVACVGQQIISGSRVPNGFQDRSLPHFAKKSKDPPSKGFVRNSFFSGLTPTEFLFHAISGREGLVDTAVKTAETGYMQRRLMKALEDLSTHYDTSVRNSVGGVVQFIYGDDGLDPAELEGDALPVEYHRSWKHAKAITQHFPSRGLLPYEIRELVASELTSRRFTKDTTAEYRQQISDFFNVHIIQKAAEIRKAFGLDPANERKKGSKKDLSLGADYEARTVVDNKTKIREEAVKKFLDVCWVKYMRAKIEPGSAVGAVGAQSIGEPGTQMTLKTFHFAGVASMNVTLGVPRIKEIINAAKVINTPIIEAKLIKDDDERIARVIKARIEKTYLSDIASIIEEVWGRDYAYIGVHIDKEIMHKLGLEVSIHHIVMAIRKAPRLRITEDRIQVIGPGRRIRVYLPRDDENGYYSLKTLKREIGKIVISGIHAANRAVVSNEKGKYKVLVEGYGLKQVMTTLGVEGKETKTNHVMDMREILGIEAARSSVYNEIQTTMKQHGMSIDPRHVMLLADVMTYKGEVLGITRFGVAKMKDSVLMLASFEKTTDHLFDAALFGKTDGIEGVSESIIMGNPAKGLGTGLPALVSAKPNLRPPRRLIFDV